MQHLRTLELLFSGTPQFRFNRKQNKIFLDIDWERDAQLGKYVVIQCMRAMRPDTITLTGTLTGTTSSNVMVGTSTIFDQEILENDMITLSDGQEVQVRKINSPTNITLATSLSANVTVSPNTGVSMYLAGNTTSASRNVITHGVATLLQVASNTWMIYGTGVV
jgi:hypothetical protein